MSNTNIGLKLAVDGEKEFRSSIRDINQAFRVLGSEMQLISSQFDKNDKSAAALTARKSVLTKEITAQKDKITVLKDALENSANSFGENDKRTQNWQIQLNKAQAELNGMERELNDNNKALEKADKALDGAGKETDEFGKSVDKAGDEIDETGKETNKLGKEMDETSKKTSVFGDVLKATLLAEAIKGGAKALVDMVKSVGAAVKDYISESSEMATEAAMSHTLLTQVMENMMDATDDEVESLVRLAEQQEKLGVVSKTAQTTALAELASFVERKESLEDMLPVMNDYIAYQYGATASSEQARNVATSLGKAIDGNIDGLSKQGFKLTQAEKEWFKTASEMERVEFVTNMVSESMGGVNEALAATDAGKMASLKTVMDNTKISVGMMANEFKAQILGQMLPSISSLSEGFLGVISGEGSVEEMAGSFDDVLNDVVNVITEFLPKLIDIGSNLITALVTGISANIDTIINGAIEIVNQLLGAILDLLPTVLETGTKLLFGLVDGIIQALPMLVEAAVQLVVSLVEGIGDALPKLIPAAIEAVLTIVDGLIDNLPMILNAALQLILGLTDGLIAALPKLIAALPKIIIGIVDFLIKSIPQIINAGIQLLVSLVGALPQIITSIVRAIPQIITGLVNAIVGNISQIINAGIKLLVSLIANLPKIIAEIVKAVPQIVSGIVTGIIQCVPQLISAGGELIKGVWQGISDTGAWLRDKISGFFGGVVTSIKNFFGIRSPSTLFRDQIGKNMALGVGVGFADEMDDVSKAMQEAIPTTLDAPDLDINAGINTAFHGGNSIGDFGGKLDGIAGIMMQMFPKLIEAMDIKVVLDDGTLVGRLAPEIDRNLALLKRRGLVGV